MKKELILIENVRRPETNFYDGFMACLPTVMGYLGIGIAMGIVGKGIGLSVWQVLLMSIFVYAGSAQFAICGLLVLQAPVFSIVFTVFFINLRHFLMSLSVAHWFKKDSLLSNLGVGSLLTDESYGVLVTEVRAGKKISSQWMHGLNVTAYLAWILATGLGALLGNFIPDPKVFGLDFALTAMFLGLFWFQVKLPLTKRRKQTLLLLTSTIVSLVLLMRVTTAEIAVIGAALIGCTVGMVTADE